MYHHHNHQGNTMLSSRKPFPQERHLLLHGPNIPADSGLVLSTDAKPRLKWTSELHERFIEAVNQLGGAEKATPKTVMRLMGVPGLTLYHLKSHLQKYRLSKNLHFQASTGTANNNGYPLSADRESEGSESLVSTGDIVTQTNKTMHISEALQMQIEVQRRLHEQLEVQRHLQLRIEAQGKYLQSVLEKAQDTLGKQNLSPAGLEAAKVQLSELVSKVSNECLSTEFTGLEEFPSLLTLQAHTSQLTDCSMDSCLTSCEGSQKDQEIHNINMGLGSYCGRPSQFTQHCGEDVRLEQPQFTWCTDMNKSKISSTWLVKKSDRTVGPVQRDLSRPGIVSQTQPEERNEGFQYAQQESKMRAIQHEKEKQTNGFGVAGLAARLDLNAYNHGDAVPSGKEFDLNDFSWS